MVEFVQCLSIGAPNHVLYSISIVAIPSTAVNTSQGDLEVTLSRGYKRTNFIFDDGIEGFNECDVFCFDASSANWIGGSPAGGDLDASFFFFSDFAHAGNGVVALGSVSGEDALAGRLRPARALKIMAGKQYNVSFFHAGGFARPSQEAAAFVDVQ